MSPFKSERRADGVHVLTFDLPESRQNVLRPDLQDALEAELDAAEEAGAKAIVFASGKPGSFVAGADIEILREVESADKATQMSKSLQKVLSRMASFPVPIVCAIDGACLGGGLELALACADRVASTHLKTRLGLPEVKLGLLPGAGGTQRLVPRVGIESALDLLLTGRTVDARKAKKMGLLHETVAPSLVVEAAVRRALELAEREAPIKSSFGPDLEALQSFALTGNALGRSIVFAQAEKAALAKSGGHYPAIPRILEVVRVGLEKGLEAGLEAEALAFGELLMTDVSQRLVELFFATKALEKDPGVDGPVELRPTRRLGVLGAGLMGRGIAFVTVEKADLPVVLRDRDDTAVGAGLRTIHGLLEDQGRRRKRSDFERRRRLLNIEASTRREAFHRCDVVIEAVFEDLELKRALLREVEETTPEGTIFASNTSSIPIGRIAEAARRKDRVVGMHYFSPVHRMPLLEVIRTPETSDETVATCVALGKQQGKTVIVVNDGVGFYTSRILGPYLNEAAWMLTEGIPIETIDAAAKRVGFPVGPITLLDEVGIDVAAKVAKIAESAFGARLHPPSSLERLVEDGRTGRKGRKGFYVYDERKKIVDESVYEVIGVKPDRRAKVEGRILEDRLLVMMVQEAIRCFDEGIVRSARDADIGAVFGLGFPPFRGGPLSWTDAVGPSELLRRMRGLHDRLGARFEPPSLLERMAKDGRRFH
ncbi:MAG: fatty acid oxidation complex subunit alpha FadJ [Myxococcota bacterium]